MEQPDNRRIAVAQAPYSAIPGAPSTLERIAGATTDIQYIIHQGFTGFGATYWVGANALLRRCALDDIAVTEWERGFPVIRYIQDRTVIEDTESSVDLVQRGWQLHNYPERLSYSATPPDFGSLLIQRRRWANGGLIILPKLMRYLASGRARRGEGFMRFHYLASITAINFGLLLLLAVPFTGSIESPWLPLTAASYFLLYGRDLKLIGYRFSDLFRVYALNLLLIPVNIGGVLKSIQQAWTRQKIPFGRTPKIAGRTHAAPLYLIAVYVMLGSWVLGATFDLFEGQEGLIQPMSTGREAADHGRFRGAVRWACVPVRHYRLRKGRTLTRVRPGSIVSSAPSARSPAICRNAVTTGLPIASGLTSSARICTALGLLP